MTPLALIALPLFATCFALFFAHRDRGIAFNAIVGAAVQFLLALPAGFAQVTVVPIPGLSGENWREIASIPVLAAPFNMGGLTVRGAFELLVEPLEFLVGHRSATVMSNFGFFLVLLAIQVGAVALLFAYLRQRRGAWLDTRIGALAAVLLINSLANVRWPWWGS